MQLHAAVRGASMASLPHLEINWIRRSLCSLICNRFNEEVNCIVCEVGLCVTGKTGVLLGVLCARFNRQRFNFHHQLSCTSYIREKARRQQGLLFPSAQALCYLVQVKHTHAAAHMLSLAGLQGKRTRQQPRCSG